MAGCILKTDKRMMEGWKIGGFIGFIDEMMDGSTERWL